MRNYWSCSTFADWLRGTPKLNAGDDQEWAQWRQVSKQRHPWRYWLAEEGLDHLQNVWCWIPKRINDIRNYINNRWITSSHALTAHPQHIRPGEWQDLGYRFLPCMFNELVDFVEVETAWHHVLWDKEARRKYKTPWTRNFFRFRTWRSPEAGVAHLQWALSLTNRDFINEGEKEERTHQALAAQEILELYTWWKEVYPKRPDVHDASGWTAYCDMRSEKGYDFLDMQEKTSEEAEQCRVALVKCNEIEKAYDDEDEAMMIRLIKVRKALWT